MKREEDYLNNILRCAQQDVLNNNDSAAKRKLRYIITQGVRSADPEALYKAFKTGYICDIPLPSDEETYTKAFYQGIKRYDRRPVSSSLLDHPMGSIASFFKDIARAKIQIPLSTKPLASCFICTPYEDVDRLEELVLDKVDVQNIKDQYRLSFTPCYSENNELIVLDCPEGLKLMRRSEAAFWFPLPIKGAEIQLFSSIGEFDKIEEIIPFNKQSMEELYLQLNKQIIENIRQTIVE